MYITIHIRSILHIAAGVLCPRKLLMNGQISLTCRKDGDMLSRAFVTTVIFRVARHLMPGTMLTVSAQDAPRKVDCGLGARISEAYWCWIEERIAVYRCFPRSDVLQQHWHAESTICLHYFLDVWNSVGTWPERRFWGSWICVTLPLFLECCVQLWPIYANIWRIQEPKVFLKTQEA